MEKTTGRRLALALGLASGWLAGAAHAMALTPTRYGSPAPLAQASRHIALRADTRWVNVDDGDTVQFLARGDSFTWHFCTPRGSAVFDLQQITPAHGSFPNVRVYVASNPLTHN